MSASTTGSRQRSGRASIANSIEGIEYQFLYGWFRCLDLLREVRGVISVSIEDPTALLVTLTGQPSSVLTAIRVPPDAP